MYGHDPPAAHQLLDMLDRAIRTGGDEDPVLVVSLRTVAAQAPRIEGAVGDSDGEPLAVGTESKLHGDRGMTPEDLPLVPRLDVPDPHRLIGCRSGSNVTSVRRELHIHRVVWSLDSRSCAT